jgi:hypothetical protein
VARAVAAQYANVSAVEHVYPLVRSRNADRVLSEIEEAPGIVRYAAGEGSGSTPEGKCGEMNVRACRSSVR